MSSDEDLLRNAYAPDRFRRDGAAVIEALAAHLAAVLRGEGAVHPAVPPRVMAAQWPATFPELPEDDVTSLVTRVAAGSIAHHHPRFTGHQVTAPLPHAALFGLVGSLLNNGMAAYESGPAATAMERAVVRWLAERAGLGARADGVLTSGGSLGNLTALLVARQARAGFDVWAEGVGAGPPLAILAAEEAHYSVARAAQVLGLGREAVVAVPVDARRRMRADALEGALRAADAAGRKVFAVVASAGSTSTGAIDPLDAIAEWAEARGVWFHVDGAHGASLLLDGGLRERLAGIERADSIVWDLHKLMLIPSLATAVLFRNGADGWLAFAQRAPYLFGDDDRGGREAAGDPAAMVLEDPDAAYDIGLRTVECTKRMIGMQVYATLRLVGTRAIAGHVRRRVELARGFAETLAASSDFEVAVPPECNIVCFRHRGRAGSAAAEIDAHQDAIRTRLNAGGKFVLTRTRFGDRTWLRATLQSPFTTESDLAALLDAIRSVAGA